MDTRTNGSFDNKKNNEDKRSEKQEKLDISRNLRRVNLEVPKSESKDPRNQAEQRENKNQEARRDIKAYRPNSNRPVAKPVSNSKSAANYIPTSKPESNPSQKESNNTHSEKKVAKKETLIINHNLIQLTQRKQRDFQNQGLKKRK